MLLVMVQLQLSGTMMFSVLMPVGLENTGRYHRLRQPLSSSTLNSNCSDLFAANGFLVILPDYFRGDVFPESLRDQGEFMCKHTKWQNLQKDIDDKVIPFARINGFGCYQV